MKSMLEIAMDVVRENGELSFKDIFNKVKSIKESEWKQDEEGNKLTEEKYKGKLEKKQGELFTYLTLDGRFVMTNTNVWDLVENHSFENIKKMRINVGENNEE